MSAFRLFWRQSEKVRGLDKDFLGEFEMSRLLDALRASSNSFVKAERRKAATARRAAKEAGAVAVAKKAAQERLWAARKAAEEAAEKPVVIFTRLSLPMGQRFKRDSNTKVAVLH
jgi:hypothetical protein